MFSKYLSQYIENDNLKYNIFGSKDSIDIDVLFETEKSLTLQECKTKETQLKLSDPNININLCTTQNGVVTWCYKGTIDEVNNSLYTTYKYHENKHECFVSRLVERDVINKVARCCRILLQYRSRTDDRDIIKYMLKQTVYDQLQYLLSVKFDDNDNLKTSHVEYKKSVAFQIGQTYMLLNNIEAYDKQSISEYLFILSDYLYRKETTYKMLNRVKQNFIYKVLASFSKLELNIREKI